MGSERELCKLRELIELQARHNAVLRRAVERNTDFPEVVRIAPSLGGPRRYRRTRPLTRTPVTGWSEERPQTPLRPSPGWENLSLADKPCKVIAYLAFGFARDELERIVEMVSREQRRLQNFVPLFITDSLQFDVFRLRGYVVEHIPSGDPLNYGAGLAIALRRRMQTIVEKWSVGAVVQFGRRGLPAELEESGALILFYPDYTPYNSYQSRFYQSCPPGYTAQPGTIEAAIRRLGDGRTAIFHLHWEDHVFRGAWPDAAAERELCQAFLKALRYFIDGGGIFIWTVHNLQPHDKFHAEIHREFQSELLALAHRLHVHSRLALAELQSRSRADIRGKVDIIPHGNYCGLKRVKRARRDDATELLFFGQVRPYKGIEDLLQAVDRLAADGEDLRLTIAGSKHGKLDLSQLRPEAADRITLVNRAIVESEIPGFYSAADFAVAPYRMVTTPGSLILALSLGVPVIAPALPPIRELLEDAPVGLLYDPEDRNGLTDALRRACHMSAEQRSMLKRNALAKAREWDWSALAGPIVGFLSAASSLASVGR
jgi:glycosyltransferase involved in cell wall biosynthesis